MKKGATFMKLYKFFCIIVILIPPTKKSKALSPCNMKNLVLESLGTWVTISIHGYKILNLKISFSFWIN